MSVFKCKMCGGTIEFEPGDSIGTCDSCGTKQTLPKLDNEEKANLYDRANHFRRNRDFDKAMGIYEQILNKDKMDAESYWSLVLCRYGIEYVEDPVSHKRVPTVNRTQFTSIFMDEDYKSAIQYADGYQKIIYEQEAKAIDEIQKKILEVSQKEQPFDVFICYKETDNNGKRTQDSVIANDLYHHLTQEGFKVFFSRITLEDKLGVAYEPYIFAALNSAKVMVVLGTRKEYFNAVWVKNEWSRYLALIRSGAKKMLIPAYRDMDPYDLPEEFSHLQAQDISKLGFMQDLIRGIKKIIETDKSETVTKGDTINNGGNNVEILLKRAFMFLEDGNFSEADKYCEKVLDQEPENAQAYLGKLMAELKVTKQENLANLKKPFDDNDNYQKILRFGTSDCIKKCKDSAKACRMKAKQREEKQKRAVKKTVMVGAYIGCICAVFALVWTTRVIPNNKYKRAISLINEGNVIEAYEQLIELNGYKDSTQKIAELFVPYEVEKIKETDVGNVVLFGAYEQDNDISNGKERIEWRILEKENNKVLLISDKALDCQPYNDSLSDITWENCSLRKWMNETFLNEAFIPEEQNKIEETILPADKNRKFRTDPGSTTKDKVFLLGYSESIKYFSGDKDRKCVPSMYTREKISNDFKSTETVWWWLRSPSIAQNMVDIVDCYGMPSWRFIEANSDTTCVRPALWVNLD